MNFLSLSSENYVDADVFHLEASYNRHIYCSDKPRIFIAQISLVVFYT